MQPRTSAMTSFNMAAGNEASNLHPKLHQGKSYNQWELFTTPEVADGRC